MFFFDAFMDAGGDVEIAEIFATKRARCGFEAGELDAAKFLSRGGIVTNDAGTVAKSDPQVVVFIDAHAIGRGIQGCRRNDTAFVAQQTIGVIECQNFATRGIDVIDRATITRPDNAIRVGDGTESFADAEVGAESIEFGIARLLDETDCAGKKMAIGRALAIIEAIVRFLGFGISDGSDISGGRIEEKETVIARAEQSAVRARDDRADALSDIP